MQIMILILLAIASGIAGRCGGAKGYDTKYRDIGCSAIVVVAVILVLGWYSSFWWVYLLMFAAHWAAFSTYQDTIWGYDNLWASGVLVGLAAFPAYWLGVPWWVIGIRAIVLCLAWGLLNKYLPPKVWVWRRDVVEEFSRYFVSL